MSATATATATIFTRFPALGFLSAATACAAPPWIAKIAARAGSAAAIDFLRGSSRSSSSSSSSSAGLLALLFTTLPLFRTCARTKESATRTAGHDST